MIDAKELVYAVDESNHPIESVERKLAHATGIWHRVSHILVFNSTGEILCSQRSMKKDNDSGKWECLFGGHIAPGSKPVEGAVRELREEIGIDAKVEELEFFQVHKYQSVDGLNREFQYVYLLLWDGPEDKLVKEPDEVEQLKWRPIVEVNRILEPPTDWVNVGYEQAALTYMQESVKGRGKE
jgi:isopentenyldiphosphate isomerase